MANTHNLFINFNSNIRLNDNKRKGLISSRNDLRDKIKKYFTDEKPKEIQPKFAGQGSFSMDTIINPIPRYDEDGNTLLYYDMDYGVYFIGEEKQEDRKSIQTYHSWILAAVTGHTKSQTDKKTCVRVNYADGHNIDFPIYYKIGEGKPELAHKAKGWLKSDPKEMTEWFDTQTKDKPQLRRIVRYLKAWADYREFKNESEKMPSGLSFTVLASNNYSENERDDIAFKDTLIKIQEQLKKKFECYCPATPQDEILASRYNNEDYFMKWLDNLIEDARKAIEETNYLKASNLWQKHFGDRFPDGKDEEDADQKEKNKLANLLGSAAAITNGKAFTNQQGEITTNNSGVKNQPHKFYD